MFFGGPSSESSLIGYIVHLARAQVNLIQHHFCIGCMHVSAWYDKVLAKRLRGFDILELKVIETVLVKVFLN